MNNTLGNLVILAAALTLARPGYAQVVANAESGTADAGIASKPIPDVAKNDTVGGQPALLVNPGKNAVVATVSGFQSGMIALNTGTGAVTTTVAVPAGTYPVTYSLCDLSAPPNCTSQTDTVTVVPSSIVAAPDSGSGVAGVPATVVTDIATNDTVNGAQAILGNLASGGNATVAQSTVAPWPDGIALTPTTGAVKTTASLEPGTYSLHYTLCDRNGPPANCNSSGLITVVISSAITALPIAGSAVVGTSGTPVGNVGIPDTVNNGPVTFGVGGTATVVQGDGWPAGLTLDTSTGAINSDPTVPVGTYPLPFTLCDTNSPANCSSQPGIATVAITPAFTEVQASPQQMGDVEFDFGRDGASCPNCNFGDGNDRANWTDRLGHIWIAHLDPSTGLFPTPTAEDELADSSAYFWNTYGNGPEWAFSTPPGASSPVSQLVYSRYQPGQPAQPQPGPGFSGAAIATQTGFNSDGSANWQAAFFPGALVAGSVHSNLPEASQCNTDLQPLAVWHEFGSPLKIFSEPVSTAKGTAPTLIPFLPGATSNGIGERFVPCTHQLLYQAEVPYGASGQTVQQVFWYDIDAGTTEQLTTDPTSKSAGFMFKAPDFNDNYIFFTLTSHLHLDVYEQTGTNPDGSPAFMLVNSIYSPDPNETYMNSPEPFINCTPVCTTYVFVTLSNGASQKGVSSPNGLAVAALSPSTPLFYILVQTDDPATRQRLDPEYYITPQGPYLYYGRIVPLQPGISQYKNTGEWFIDMHLGAPSGSCVGSSAEDGLAPGC